MSVNSYEELRAHAGHQVVVVDYEDMNVAIECEDCLEILLEFKNGR